MATRKISLTLDEDMLEQVRSLTGARGISAFVDDAVRTKLETQQRRRSLLDSLDRFEEIKPSTKADVAAGEQWAADLDRRHG